MKRKRDICKKCRYFFSGKGDHDDRRYAFCMNTDIRGDSSFYEFIARVNPDSCPEKEFFNADYEEDIFSECPFKAEQLIQEWNK